MGLLIATLSLTLTISMTEPPATEVPQALRKAFLQRATPGTAHFKYQICYRWPDLGAKTQNTEIWYAGDDLYRIESGDDDGIRVIEPSTGAPMLGVGGTCLPEYVVFNHEGDRWWSLQGGTRHLGLNASPMRLLFADVRSFGLYAREIQDKTPSQMLELLSEWAAQGQFRDAENSDGTHTVTLRFPPSEAERGHVESRWEVDPAKGHAISRVTEFLVHEDGSREVLSEANSDYALTDGRWWPRKTESLCPNSKWYCAVEYRLAEFDKPDHPKSITPDLMGVPVGIAVHAWQIDPSGGCRYLGQGQFATPEEWSKISLNYDLTPLFDWVARQRKLGSGEYPAWWYAGPSTLGLDNAAYSPDAWETYVRRWIIKRTATPFNPVASPLDEKQVNAAWGILKDCRSHAEPISRRIAKELETVRKDLASLNPAKLADQILGDPAEKAAIEAAVDKRLALESRVADLEKPKELAAIFEQLKERLDRLLTSKQLAEEGVTTTQPVRRQPPPRPPPIRPAAVRP